MWWFVSMICYLFAGALIAGLLERISAKANKRTSDDLSFIRIASVAGEIVLWPLLSFVILALIIAYWSERKSEKEAKS